MADNKNGSKGEKQENGGKSAGGLFSKLKGVKNIELVFVVLLAAIVVAVFLSAFTSNTASPAVGGDFSAYVASEEARLAKLLSGIKGAGRVEVMITYSSGIEYEYAYETKSQTAGGTTTTTTELIYSQGKPVIINEKSPKIKGVVVVAEGAGNAAVKLEILKAVQTLLKVTPGTIEIFVLKK